MLFVKGGTVRLFVKGALSGYLLKGHCHAIC